eukprot:63959-Pleurochrysis_carterae.AAC.2
MKAAVFKGVWERTEHRALVSGKNAAKPSLSPAHGRHRLPSDAQGQSLDRPGRDSAGAEGGGQSGAAAGAGKDGRSVCIGRGLRTRRCRGSGR